MIGEGSESEAILPLSKLEALLNRDGGVGKTIQIVVNAGVGDPIEIGRRVAQVLKAYVGAGGKVVLST